MIKTLLMLSIISCLAALSVPAIGAENKYAQGNNDFAFELYGQLAQNSKGNIFFSPYSLSSALAMTYNGASGNTAKQMAQTLHFDTDTASLNKETQEMKNSLTNSENKYELNIANAMWGQNGQVFLEPFLANIKAYYGSALNKVDFIRDTEGARNTINRWVSGNTKGKIPELIKPKILNADTRFVLTNAIYFKGLWFSPFKSGDTKESDFYVNETKVTKTKMMFAGGKKFSYCEVDGVQALNLKYSGGSLAMLIALPSKKQDIAVIETQIKGGLFSKLVSSLDERKVQVYLPKFKSESVFELARTLSAMGMTDAFTAAADFSAMTGKKELYISKVIHQAVVEVNEKGTEAAAATAVVGMFGSAMPRNEPIVIFKADHPFIYFIYDTKTGIILFMGRMMESSRGRS
jgi:serpin B